MQRFTADEKVFVPRRRGSGETLISFSVLVKGRRKEDVFATFSSESLVPFVLSSFWCRRVSLEDFRAEGGDEKLSS